MPVLEVVIYWGVILHRGNSAKDLSNFQHLRLGHEKNPGFQYLAYKPSVLFDE
jgi:hypothetical protein